MITFRFTPFLLPIGIIAQLINLPFGLEKDFNNVSFSVPLNILDG